MSRGRAAASPAASFALFPVLACIVLVLYAPPAFLAGDLPELPALAGRLVPWQWPWGDLGSLAVQLGAFAIVLAGAGAPLARIAVPRTAAGADRALAALAFGIGIQGTAVLGFGLLGLSRREPVLALYAVAGLLGIREARVPAAWLARALPQVKPRRAMIPGLLVGGWVAAFGIADLLAPEAFWDALVYHLAAPKQWLDGGRITAVGPFFNHFPLLMSANYLVALAAWGEGLARAVNLLAGGLLVWAAARTAAGWLDAKALSRGVMLALASPLLVLLALHAGADTGCALFSCLAVLALVRAAPGWPRGPVHRGWLAVAGAAGGFAAATKLQGFAVPAIVAALAVAGGIRTASAVRLVIAPAVAGWMGWGLKSWLFTGNPVFPLLDGVFGSPFWTAFSREAYGNELAAVRAQLGWADFGLFGDAGGAIARFKRGLTGPVPVLAACALVLWPWPRGMRIPALFTAALAALWAFSVPAYRFLSAGLVLLPFMLVRAGDGAAGRGVAAAALLIQIAWIPLVLHVNDAPWEAARGIQDRDGYYASLHTNTALDAVGIAERFGRPAPRRRMLVTGDVRAFLMPRYSIVASYFEPSPLLAWARESGGADRLFVRLKQRGVRFLLINPAEFIRVARGHRLVWTGEIPEAVLEDFFSRHATLEYARGTGWIYEVERRANGAALPECFRQRKRNDYGTSMVCVTSAQAALAGGDLARATRFAWSAVAAGPYSGLAWATLGDCMYAGGKWDEAVNIYKTALVHGWRTSAVYRNSALASGRTGNWAAARTAMGYAYQIDPSSRRVYEDYYAVHDKWLEGVRKGAGGP